MHDKLSLEFKPLGEMSYKNIAKPVRTYTVAEGAAVTSPRRGGTARTAAFGAIVANTGNSGRPDGQADSVSVIALEATRRA